MLTPEQRMLVEERLKSDFRYNNLITRHNIHYKKGRFTEALKVKHEMQEYVAMKLNEYEESITTEYISVNDFENSLPEQLRDNFRSRLDSICFIIDILDTCVKDLNDICKHSADPINIIFFERIIKIGKEATDILNHYKESSPEHAELWADTLDSLEEYFFMRAKAYRKKTAALATKLEKQRKHDNTKQPTTHKEAV